MGEAEHETGARQDDLTRIAETASISWAASTPTSVSSSGVSSRVGTRTRSIESDLPAEIDRRSAGHDRDATITFLRAFVADLPAGDAVARRCPRSSRGSHDRVAALDER
jgi:hypothetical protein